MQRVSVRLIRTVGPIYCTSSWREYEDFHRHLLCCIELVDSRPWADGSPGALPFCTLRMTAVVSISVCISADLRRNATRSRSPTAPSVHEAVTTSRRADAFGEAQPSYDSPVSPMPKRTGRCAWTRIDLRSRRRGSRRVSRARLVEWGVANRLDRADETKHRMARDGDDLNVFTEA